MRLRLTLLLSLVLFASSAFAIDRWIPISGTVGNFSTDSRVFNPSFDKDIEIQATLIKVGDGTNRVGPVTFTVAKRQMKVFDNVVATLFTTDGLGAIVLTSEDEFVATSRIFATVAAGTLGQFSVANPASAALTRGVIIQLKSSPSFRTNIGSVNPGTEAATVTWKLYDKANAVVDTKVLEMTPGQVVGPTRLESLFTVPGGTELSDAWVGFSSTKPIFAYGSVVDNGTTDQTFVPALHDTSTEPPPPPKIVNITARDFSFTLDIVGSLRVNDDVTFRVKADSGAHGIIISAPNFSTILDINSLNNTVIERTIKLTQQGTYAFFCTNSLCGSGHTSMVGEFTIGPPSGNEPPDRY